MLAAIIFTLVDELEQNPERTPDKRAPASGGRGEDGDLKKSRRSGADGGERRRLQRTNKSHDAKSRDQKDCLSSSSSSPLKGRSQLTPCGGCLRHCALLPSSATPPKSRRADAMASSMLDGVIDGPCVIDALWRLLTGQAVQRRKKHFF